MNAVLVYLRIYGQSLQRALSGIAKNPWTLLLPPALFVIDQQLEGLLYLILGGLIAGFVVWAVMAALSSCYLYFLGEVVANRRVRLQELRGSIGTYFWSIANIMFVIWIAQLILTPFLSAAPQGGLIYSLLELAAVIIFNAVPEVIYQRGTYGGLATFQRSLAFLQENWIEWGIPNVLGLAAVWEIYRQAVLLVGYGGVLSSVLQSLLAGALLHLLMVFRGHLFQVLDGSSHRQRMFKYRTDAG